MRAGRDLTPAPRARPWRRAAAVLPFLAASCGDLGCGNTVLQDAVSPDGRRHAVVYVRNCGATTGFGTDVSILPSVRGVRGAGNVFVADADHGRAPERPGGGLAVTARWLDRRTLELRYDGRARVFRRDERHDDTNVRYVADPPVPAPGPSQ